MYYLNLQRKRTMLIGFPSFLDMYWPKQELESGHAHRALTQEEMMMYNPQYYGNGYVANVLPHHHVLSAYAGAGQTSPINYETGGTHGVAGAAVPKNAGSAFSLLSAGSGRNAAYYSDPFGAAMKSQNGLNDMMPGKMTADHFAGFTGNAQGSLVK